MGINYTHISKDIAPQKTNKKHFFIQVFLYQMFIQCPGKVTLWLKLSIFKTFKGSKQPLSKETTLEICA